VTAPVTIPADKHRLFGVQLAVIPIASLLADVILRIHDGRSVGELFHE